MSDLDVIWAALKEISNTVKALAQDLNRAKAQLHGHPTGSSGVIGTLHFQDEGVPQGDATTLNAAGAGVTLSIAGSVATLTIPGGVGPGGAGHTIQDEGTNLPTQPNLNFIGDGVTATNNAITNATDVTIPTTGDMLQTNYDNNSDNVVDAADYAATAGDADTVDGEHASAFADASHTHLEADITDLDHTDANAIHDNVAGEIAAIANKAAPIAADMLIIEDSADANNKKMVQIGDLPFGGTGDMTQAVYDPDLDNQVEAADYADTAGDADTVDGEHASAFADASHTHLEVDITDLDHTDANAIHDNVAGEIIAITEKVTPIGTDVLVIEDSADGNNKKRIQISHLGAIATGDSGTIEVGVDGHGSAPTTGIVAMFIVPYNLTITGWTLIADLSGAIVVDLWRDVYANYPPTIADTQTGDQKPTLAASNKDTSSVVTHWTVNWNAGDVVFVNIDSVSTLTKAVLSLDYIRS